MQQLAAIESGVEHSNGDGDHGVGLALEAPDVLPKLLGEIVRGGSEPRQVECIERPRDVRKLIDRLETEAKSPAFCEAPRWRVVVSPKKPSKLSVVQAATTTSPGRSCSATTCIIQLSPGCSSTVTAVPQRAARG